MSATPANLDRLPSVLALALHEYHCEADPLIKAWQLCEAIELCLRTVVALSLSDWARATRGDLPADLRRQLGPRIEQPTMGKWRGMALALTRRAPPDTPLPELYAFFAQILDPALDGKEVTQSLIALRNRLAHGGGMSRKLAATLLAAHDERVAGIFAGLDWLADVAFVVPGDPPRAMRGPTTALSSIDPAIAQAIDPALHDKPRSVIAVRNRVALSLWPLVQYGPPGTISETAASLPLMYARFGAVGLVLTPLGSDDVAMAEAGDDARASLTELTRVPAPPRSAADWQVAGFDAEVRRDANQLVGRTRERDAVRDAIAAQPTGVVWMHGPAGIGKSMVLASAIAQLESPSLIYRFKRGDPRCTREQFLQFAIERLEAAQANDEQTPATRSRQRPSVRRLKQLLATPIIIALDGLDEIAAVDPAFVTDLPLALASQARWICVGRREHGLDRAFTDARCEVVFPKSLPPLSADDVRAMLLAKIGPLSKRLLQCDRDDDGGVNPFVERVVARAGGLPIYVAYVIGDVLSGKLRAFDDDTGLPPSIEAYHAKLLRRTPVGSVHQILTPIAATLALAREPLAADVLAEALVRRTLLTDDDAGRALVERALLTMAALLERDPASGGFMLFHASLRDYLATSDDTQIAITTARAALAQAIATAHHGPASALQRYVFRHGVAHLVDGDRHADAAALLTSFAYLIARLRGDPSPGGVAALLTDYQAVVEMRPDDERGALDDWSAFMRRNAHLIARGGPAALLQAAIADADTSPITIAAERWLDDAAVERWLDDTADHAWLRRVDRPRDPIIDPCVRVITGHGAAVTDLALLGDPTDLRVLSASGDATLRLWELDTGMCERVLQERADTLSFARVTSAPNAPCMHDMQGHSWTVWSVDVLDDERCAVAAHGDGTVKLWDVTTGECVASMTGHDGYVWCVRAAGQRAVSAGDDGTARVWSLAERACEAVLRHDAWVGSAALTGDGRFAVTGAGDGVVRVWDIADQRCVRELVGHRGYVRALALTPDGHHVVSGGRDGAIAMWERATGRLVRRWDAHERPVWTVSVARDGRSIVSGDAAGHIAVWPTGAGAEARASHGHAGRVWTARDIGDGCVITAGDDRTIKLWDKTARASQTRARHAGAVLAIAVRDHRAITASADATLKLWDLDQRRSLRTWTGHRGPVHAVAWLADELAISGGDDGQLGVWQVDRGRAGFHALDGMRAITALAALGDRVAVGGASGHIALWDPASGDSQPIGEHRGPVLAMCVTRRGSGAPLLVTGGGDSLIHVWDVQRRERVTTLRGHSWDVQAVGAIGDRIVSACRDGALSVWSLASGKAARTESRHNGAHPTLAIIGAHIASVTRDNCLELAQLDDDRPRARWPATHAISALAALGDRELVFGDVTGDVCRLRLIT